MQSRAAIAAVPLPPNYVWRSYVGGSELRRFRGAPGTSDDHFPEDWLASTVRARNGTNSQGINEGSTPFDNGFLIDWLAIEPEFWWGPTPAPRRGMGVLWKLLDAATRLQLQAHPDAAFARRHLKSDAGKTECWYILGTRGEAHVYLGFQRPPTREAWAGMMREQRVEEMLACFDRIAVQPGDCFVVPAGTPHAIGAGIFMMELQEPTDWVVRCETRTTDDKPLPPDACFMGLSLEACLDVFDYGPYSAAQVREKFQQDPQTLRQTDAFTEEEIIHPAWREFFRLNRLRGKSDAHWPGEELMLLVALKGEGDLSADSAMRHVRAGETWLLPGAAKSWQWLNTSADWEFLLAKLPGPRQAIAN